VYGLAASFKRHSRVEIGFKHQTTVGGDGAPGIGIGQLITEFFFVRGNAGTAQESMDNREGMDVRVQIPGLRNAVEYAEGVFEDFGRKSFWPQFTEQMGFVSGLYLPLLSKDGTNDLRLEYEHSPAAYGRYFFYRAGLTLDDRLRGSELGPDGNALHMTWRHIFSSGSLLRIEAHYEARREDNHIQTLISDLGVDRIIRITDHPAERRFRLMFSFERKAENPIMINPILGYERAWNYSFTPGAPRNNLLAAICLKWIPEN